MRNLLVLLFLPFFTISQVDTSAKALDSINAEIFTDYQNRIQEMEEIRLKDSIQRAKLMEQIGQLKTTDNLKKEELQKQLEDLNEKEIQRLDEKRRKIDALRQSANPFAVNGFFNDTLFLIYCNLGSFSGKERAAAIEERIHNLSSRLKIDSVLLVENENSVDLICGDKIIMSITENDAIWNTTSKLALARSYQGIIMKALKRYKEETSLSTLIKEIALALLVLVLMIIMLRYISRFFRWTAIKIQQNEGKKLNGVKIKDYTLFNASRQVGAFLWINNLLKWLVILIAIYITLPILFGIFPWTKDFASTLFGYFLNPLKTIGIGIWDYFPKLITIIVIIIVFRYVMKAIHYFKEEIENENLKITGFYADWANPTYQILKIVLYAFMFVLIFPYLPGSNSPIFQGVSVFLGVLFTFGSSGSLSNIVAGLVLTYMRLFKIGDRVKIGDVVGDVMEKSLLVTRIRTTKNEIISIPNSTVMSSHTINYSSDTTENGLILHTTVTIGYDVPWKKIHQALIEAAERTDLILKDPKPFVLQTSLEDFYVAYQINGYTKEANKQAKIYSDLHANIQDCCNEVGIEILSPHYEAERDGNEITIPKEYQQKKEDNKE